MLTIVHIVGEADIGSQIARRTSAEWMTARRRWSSVWAQAVSDTAWQGPVDGPAGLRSLAGTAHGAQLVAALAAAQQDPLLTWLVTADEFGALARPRPLPAILAAAAGQEVELILVVTAGEPDGVPSAPAGRALQAALEAHPDLFGAQVSVREPVATPFDEPELTARLRPLLEDPDRGGDPVSVSWSSGAIALMLGCLAAALASGRPTAAVRADRPDDPVPVTAENPPVDPLVRWLLRLGYPSQVLALADADALTPPLSKAYRRNKVQPLDQRLRAAANGGGGIEALRELVAADIRRLDSTSAFAIRRLIEETHHPLRAWATNTGRGQLAAAGHHLASRWTPTLGQADTLAQGRSIPVGAVTVVPTSRPAGVEPLSAQARQLVKAAKKSAHELVPLSVPPERFPPGLLLQPGDGARHMHLPSGKVAAVWAVGVNADMRFGPTLTDHDPDPALSAALGRRAPGQRTLSCLLIGSAESADAATKQTAALNVAAPVHWSGVTAEASTLDTRGHRDVAAAVTEWLERGTRPDAVVVPALGARDSLLEIVQAAVRYGQLAACPVFVRTAGPRGAPPSAATYHRLLSYAAADAALLRLAGHALELLTLDSAAQVLSLCADDPDLRALTARVSALREAVVSPGAADVIAVIELCAQAAERQGVAAADQIRVLQLAHAVGERQRPKDHPIRRNAHFRALGRVRNNLATTHGGTETLAALIRTHTPIQGTPPRLLWWVAAGLRKAGIDSGDRDLRAEVAGLVGDIRALAERGEQRAAAYRAGQRAVAAALTDEPGQATLGAVVDEDGPALS